MDKKFTKDQQERINELKGVSKMELAKMIVRLEAGQPAIKQPKQIVKQVGYTTQQVNEALDRQIQKDAQEFQVIFNQRMDIGISYMRALSDLYGLTALIGSHLAPPIHMPKLEQVFNGMSVKIASSLQNFINRLNALNEFDNRPEDKIDGYIEQWALVAEAIGRFENARTDDKRRQLLDEIHECFNPVAGNFYTRLHDIAKSLNFGGNVDGMKFWRLELAQEWIELEEQFNNPSTIRYELLKHYTVTDDKTGERKPKPELLEDEKKKANSLLSKTARERPDNFGTKLKEAYQNVVYENK